jgi:hypothetical protein
MENHTRSVVERFDAKYVRHPLTGCWLWTACTNAFGYGTLWVNVRPMLAHRVAYELFVGPIPEGLNLDHLCRVRRCVNPAHLEPVTQRENVMRGISVTAKNAAVTHCHQGHPFDDANTYRNNGKRQCRICQRRREKASRAKR